MATKRKNSNERRTAEREASQRYADRERDALIEVALTSLADRSIDPHEHALARQRLTGIDLADVEVDHLTSLEADTLSALLDKLVDGTTGEVDLRVVAEAKPYVSIITTCAGCKDAAWINVADLDEVSRAVLADYLDDLRHDQSKA